MLPQRQNEKSTDSDKIKLPAQFIVVCIFLFVAGILTTVYFCYSMGGEMNMPGGWNMSMMWMQMPGQRWFESAGIFLLMWLAMMIAMMMPSALPSFLKTRRRWTSQCYMAFGYFTIWLVAGITIYPVGIWLAKMEMRSLSISRIVPLVSGATLIMAGAIQFTNWKRKLLLGCRSQFGCVTACSAQEASFRIGCKQGLTCLACCATPMTILIVLGVMNPLAMMAIAIVIAAEKLLPRPEITTRVVGGVAIIAGGIMIYHWATLNYA